MNFRPFLPIAFTVALAAATFGQVGVSPQFNLRPSGGVDRLSSEGVSASTIRGMERNAFDLINKQRVEAGLDSLKWSDKVAELARLHSNNMAEYNFFSHKGLDGMMVDDRAAQLKMGAWNAIGENIAFMKGFPNPVETAVDRWLKSPSHKHNLLDPAWAETAVGLAATPDGKYYFTQVFIR
jgi:uncharacterized protein YkwD